MTPRERRAGGCDWCRTGAVLVAGLAAWLSAGRAEAQWGWGWGWGYNPENASITVNYLNQQSLDQGRAAYAARAQGPQGLTAPTIKVKDDDFFQRYDPVTRQEMENRVARNPIPLPPPATAAPAPKPVVRLANFFNASRQLIWPGDAPTTGDLGTKRATSDAATLSVLDEYDYRGLAQIATVTDARKKLLDYGRPALQYVRAHSTPAIADSFHAFLLTLYAEVGLAATVPRPAKP
jgi:hypothetical protein